MLVLEVIRGVDQGRIFPLPVGEPQLLGRSSESLPLTDRSVSRRHAELTPDGDAWWVRDLRSANGTWVNGRRVEDRVTLHLGDEITIGKTSLRLASAERLISGPAARAEGPAEVPLVGTLDISGTAGEQPGTLEEAWARLRMLETLSSLAVSSSDPEELIAWALNMLVEEFAPESAFVLLAADHQSPMACCNHRGPHEEWSEHIVNRVRESRRPLLVLDAATDARFQGMESISRLGIRSALGAPLQIAGSVFGVVLLDDRSRSHAWDEEDIRLLSAVAKQVSLAIVNANVAADLLQQTRLASMGETVATISHAVKNIMQGLRGGAGALEMAIDRGNLEMAREAWPILARNLDRIHDLTFNMLAWSRSGSLETEPVQVGPIIREAIDLLGTQRRHRKVTIALEGENELPPIPVDASALHQAVMNLLTNAIEAIPAKTGRIVVTLSVDEACQWLNCAVEDNGDGVEPERYEEVFHPFTSTKGQRGTGLGLAVTRKIAEDHGGSLVIDPEFSPGARFVLRLPLGQEGDPGDTDTPRAAGPPAVDDEFDE